MSVETYTCPNCNASFGIAGESTGSPDDAAADDYYAQEVEYHRSGECASRVITLEPVTVDPRAEYVAGLRALADVLEREPGLPLPVKDTFSWNVWPVGFADVKAEVARIRRLLPAARFKKNEPDSEYNRQYFHLSAPLHGVTLEICTYRDQVCERVVTGTREVTKTVPVQMEDIIVTEDIVEWRCHPLLAEDHQPQAVNA